MSDATVPRQLELVSYHADGIQFGIEACRVLTKRVIVQDSGARQSCLVIQAEETEPKLLAVQEPVRLRTVDSEHIYELPVLIKSFCILAGLRAMIIDEYGLTFVVGPTV